MAASVYAGVTALRTDGQRFVWRGFTDTGGEIRVPMGTGSFRMLSANVSVGRTTLSGHIEAFTHPSKTPLVVIVKPRK